MSHAVIALGGNQGSVVENFRNALALLIRAGVEISRRSGLFETAAVGRDSGANYLNAAVVVSTRLPASELLGILLETETALGRERQGVWGPRPIDLDLIWYDDLVCETPGLTLPHPACWYRRFVLDPLCDVCPDWVHPFKRVSIRELRERLRKSPLSVGLAGGTVEHRNRLRELGLRQRSSIRMLDCEVPANESMRSSIEDPAVIAWLGPANRGFQVTKQKSGIERPQSESLEPEFLRWPTDRRLDVSIAAAKDDAWLEYLLQSIADEPRRIADEIPRD